MRGTGVLSGKLVRSPYLWLALAGFGLYTITFFSGFVDDDIAQVVNQTQVHSLHGVIWSFRIGEGLFRPLMFSYFMLCYALFRLHAWGYHLFEIIFGVVNVLLIYWLLKQFFSQKASFWLAVIYLISPINVDAVAYVSHIQDVLFMFFGLLALRVIKWEITAWLKGFLAGLFILASLLSKETGALFIPMALIFTWLFSRRDKLIIYTGGFLGIAAYIFLRYIAPNDHSVLPPFAPVSHFGLVMRLLQIPSILWFYIINFLFPHRLSISRLDIVPSASWVHFWLPLLADLGLLFGIMWFGRFIYRHRRKQWTAFVFFFTWLTIGLGFHTQIVPIFDATYSNWWFYFPMVGLLGLAGLAWANIDHQKFFRYRLPAYLLLSLWLVFLVSQNIVRQINFHSEADLVSHDISVNPNSYLLQNEYGSLLINEGRYTDALLPLYKSASLLSYRNSAWDDLGVAYYYQGNIIEAKNYFKKAVNNYPDDVQAYYNYASVVINSFDPSGILPFLNMAIARFPNDILLWQLKAAAYDLYGDKAGSARDQAKAYQLARQQHIQFSVNHPNGQPFNIKLQTQ